MPVLTRRQSQILRPSYDLSNGLLAWYPLDTNTGENLSGVQNNNIPLSGTKSVAGIVRDQNCRSGASFFDGTNGYGLLTAGLKGQPLGNTPRSISAWIKMDPSINTSTFRIIVFFGVDSGSPYGNYLYVASDKIVHEFNSGAGKATGATTLAKNVWYHVAGVYDGSVNRVFVNGVQDGSVNYSSANTQSGVLTISAYYYPGLQSTNRFYGSIDDIRIYNRALSPGEVFSLYASAFQPIWLDPMTYLPTKPFPINIPMLGL